MSPGQSRSQALSLCDVIRPCKKIRGGCQMCVVRSIDPSVTYHKISTQIRIRERSPYVERSYKAKSNKRLDTTTLQDILKLVRRKTNHSSPKVKVKPEESTLIGYCHEMLLIIYATWFLSDFLLTYIFLFSSLCFSYFSVTLRMSPRTIGVAPKADCCPV